MPNLILICGCPGAGKSTFLKEKIKESKNDTVIISRDKIRFALTPPDEEYFKYEDDVFKNFCQKINEALAEGHNVCADQTSLNPPSRAKLIKQIKGYDKLIIFYLKENLQTCLERNELRTGTRAYVPRNVIRRMFFQLIPPTLKEGFDLIYIYDGDKKQWFMLKRS